MIEITARLLKGPAYLAGEMVECSITFSNPEDPSLKKSHSYRYVCLCVRSQQPTYWFCWFLVSDDTGVTRV